MIDIEKLRGHLGNLWAQTSMSDIGSKSKLDEALTELERLQKFKATFDAYELSQKQGFVAYENWQECENEIAILQKKEVPMKVGKVAEYAVFAPIKNVTCSRCNQQTRFSHRQSTTKYKPNYCSNCGQKLDWSDEK
jgi:hypothetical protein